jgi:hypothetical protein
MDEKGMMIGKIKKHHRIFSHKSLASGRVLGVNEDGNREWITLMATICADGTWGRPLLIYPSAASALQDTWIQAVDYTQHNVAFSATASGWTNDELGLKWLENFEVWSRAKLDNPSRDWRLLIVDGHGSHVTLKFFEKCFQKRIVLAVLPPHATHRLQPLDVGMFRPFAMKYSLCLDQWINDRMGTITFSKREFFTVFWPAFLQSFTEKNINSAWAKAGIFPRNAESIVQVVDQPTQGSRPSTSHSGTSVVSIHHYIRVRKKVRFALSGISDEMATMVSDMFEKYMFALSMAEHERDGYKLAAATEKNRRQRSKPAADATFIEKYGTVHVWDEEWYQLREEHRAQIAAQKTAADVAKEADRQRKQQEKELTQVQNAQRKAQKQALTADAALQKKITADAAAEEKIRAREENKRQKELEKQLEREQKATQKRRNTKKKPIQASKKHQEVVMIDNDAIEDIPSPIATTSRGRAVRRPKHFESF